MGGPSWKQVLICASHWLANTTHCSFFSDQRECHIKPHAKTGQFNAAWLPDIIAYILDQNPIQKTIQQSFFSPVFYQEVLFEKAVKSWQASLRFRYSSPNLRWNEEGWP